MGSLTQLLGASPRVAILEAFGEDPDLEFSVPDLVRQTGVSKRAVYIHIQKLMDEGIIRRATKRGKCQFYAVNTEDVRGKLLGYLETVFTLGKVERELKADYELAPSQPLPASPLGPYPTWRDAIPVVVPEIRLAPGTTPIGTFGTGFGATLARTSGSAVTPDEHLAAGEGALHATLELRESASWLTGATSPAYRADPLREQREKHGSLVIVQSAPV